MRYVVPRWTQHTEARSMDPTGRSRGERPLKASAANAGPGYQLSTVIAKISVEGSFGSSICDSARFESHGIVYAFR